MITNTPLGFPRVISISKRLLWLPKHLWRFLHFCLRKLFIVGFEPVRKNWGQQLNHFDFSISNWSETQNVLHFLLEQFGKYASAAFFFISFPGHFWSQKIWQGRRCVYFIGFHYSRNNSPPTFKKGEAKYRSILYQKPIKLLLGSDTPTLLSNIKSWLTCCSDTSTNSPIQQLFCQTSNHG